jgi:excisionase family DNA binding protein
VEKLLSVTQTADLLGIKKSTIYQYARRQLIPHVKLGSRLLFEREQLADWVRRNRRAPTPRMEPLKGQPCA